jgi:hypothetical protein
MKIITGMEDLLKRDGAGTAAMAAMDYLKNWQHVQTCWLSIAMARASQHILRDQLITKITLSRDRTIVGRG